MHDTVRVQPETLYAHEEVLAEIEAFVTGARLPPRADRILSPARFSSPRR